MKSAIFFFLFFVLLCIDVNAISVVSDYLENNTLELIEGTSKLYSIRLQNPTEYETAVKLDYDKSFMQVIDYKDIYTLPPKTNYKVLFNVTAPENLGLYTVGFTVSEVEPGGGGILPILLKINRNFKLKVVRDPNKFYINYDYVAYAIIALVLLSYVFWKKYSTKRKKRKS
jgi:hypothetical protein